MYNHSFMDPDISIKSLQRKVQFDIYFYFAWHVAENMEKMKENTFKLKFNEKLETWYVIKDIDELSKNHKNIDKNVSGFMPENKDDRLCPVRSFQLYLSHLSPQNEFLWQTPLENIHPPSPDVWYGRQHLGKNTLGLFMTDISRECGLSMIYTNHSIRVTGATVLTRMHFSFSKIMSVTVHKSVQSLTRYQKTQDKQNISMGNVMHQSLTNKEDYIVVPGCREITMPKLTRAIEVNIGVNVTENAITVYTTPQVVANKENASDTIVPFDSNLDFGDVLDFDLLQMITQVEKKQNIATKVTAVMTTSTMSMMSSNVLNNVPKLFFHNCTIHHL